MEHDDDMMHGAGEDMDHSDGNNRQYETESDHYMEDSVNSGHGNDMEDDDYVQNDD